MYRRRTYVSLLAAGVTGALAGCSDGSPQDSDDGGDPPDEGDDTTPTSTVRPTATLTPTDGPPSTGGESGVSGFAAADGDDGDRFGRTMSSDGERVLVGAPTDEDPNGENAGSAYVFVRIDDGWQQEAKLAAAEGSPGDAFGDAVSLSGDTALVGARGGESASVFVRGDGDWQQEATLTPSDGDSGDTFGGSVAVDGDTALVGADNADVDGDTSAGSVSVFTRTDGDWEQTATLTAAAGTGYDHFGSAVSLSGDTALVGAATALAGAGAAYVFERTDSGWRQQTRLSIAGGDADESFGHALSLAGDTAVVTDWKNSDGVRWQGAAYVFIRSGGAWERQATLTADDGDENDQLGTSVAAVGETVLLGAYNDNDPNGEDAGSAYLFTRSGGEWEQTEKLAAPDGGPGEEFGTAVSLTNDAALVGAPNDVDGEGVGAAYAFDR